MEKVNNPISRDVDFWFDRILEGYITEIENDTIRSYNETLRQFFQGLRGHYLNSLKLWIKILVCENDILRMEESDE